MNEQIIKAISEKLRITESQVNNTLEMLEEGNTVPFIARYRKEATGSLDDQTLRALSERLQQLRSLDKRREEILRALEGQGVKFETDSRQAGSKEGTANKPSDRRRKEGERNQAEAGFPGTSLMIKPRRRSNSKACF